MELSTLVLFVLVVFAVGDVQAVPKRGTLSKRVRELEMDMIIWKGTVVNLERKMFDRFKDLELSLKEDLTTTFVPALIKPLVKEGINSIMNEDYIGNMISGHVVNEVLNLKANLQNTKTQLKLLAQKLRRAEQERDLYRKSLGKVHGKLTNDIRALQLQVNDARTSTHPGTTAASTDPSPKSTVSPAPVTTKDLEASTTDASEDLTPSTTVPPTPVTTQDSDHHATPSAAAGRDLFDASEDGDLKRVKRILAAGNADINYRGGGYRMTPVMMAAGKGRRDVVEFLVGRGADVSLVSKYGNNVLHWACNGGDLDTVKLILDLNVVDVNARNNDGETAADKARGRRYQRVLDLLVSHASTTDASEDLTPSTTVPPTPVTTQDSDHHVTPSAAAGRDLYDASEDGDLKRVKRILAAGNADINYRGGGYRMTPVMMAAGKGRRDVVEFLVGRGADVSLVSKYGNNVLHWACDGGDLDTVKLILDLNVVDVNARNNDGETAADKARGRRYQRVLDLLVSHGAH
ncbi:poly [ADP-ribose] polymerase tankyrase-1-like [Haliotis asinina]|uniref:poly [ADP-ribose] polymerase tankyrase-1-like n=1 Tax=Haliotis asinina TaxID=109174 RepID=UPI003531AD1D